MVDGEYGGTNHTLVVEADALKKRIADLEEVLRPLIHYASPDDVKVIATFTPSPDAEERFKRYEVATLYADLGPLFRRIAHLMKDRP